MKPKPTPRCASRSYKTWLLPVLAGILLPAVAPAIVYSPISDGDLLRGADEVVLAEVTAVDAVEDRERPALRYGLWLEESFRGFDSADTLDVVVPGGRTAEGLGFWIPGTPRLEVGDRVLLFLSSDAAGDDDAFRLYQHSLGLFRVVEHGSRTLVVRTLGDAAVITAPIEGLAAKGLSRSVEQRLEWPRDLDGFRSWLRSESLPVAKRRQAPAPDYFVDPATLGAGFQEKFVLLTSRTGDDFGACGDNGGRPVRRFDFAGPEADGPVQWRIYRDGLPGALEDGRDAVVRALAAWNADPASVVSQQFAGLTSSLRGFNRSDFLNTVVFEDVGNQIPGSYDGSGLLALGGPWFFCDPLRDFDGQEFHEISEGDIIVQNGVFAAFQTTPWAEELLAQLLAHELGHTFGIGHSDVVQVLMQPNLHLDARGPALEPDELAALSFLYGAGNGFETRVPPVPTGLQLLTERGPLVRLSWQPVAGASNYRIERRRIPGKYVFVTTTAASEYVDLSVDALAAYEYRVRAQTAAGPSPPSEAVGIVTGAIGRPPAPTQLRAYPISGSRVGLRWQNNACDAGEQVLLTQIRGELREVPAQIGGSETELILLGLRPNRSYSFSVRADNQFGSSPVSEPVEVQRLGDAEECRLGTELCLLDRRYRVSAEIQTAGGAWRPATARSDDDSRGFFTFFGPSNLEVEARVTAREVGAVLQWTSLTTATWRLRVVDSTDGSAWMVEPEPGLCNGEARLTDIPLATTPPGRVPSAADFEALTSSQIAAASIDGIQPAIPCGRADTDLYLEDGRFRLRLTWWDQAGTARSARAFDLTDSSGGFELSTNDELGWLFKVLDGRGLNQSFWVFGAPTRVGADLRAQLEVTDLQTSSSRVYGLSGAGGETCGLGDIHAFPQ